MQNDEDAWIKIPYSSILDEDENNIVMQFPPDSPWVPHGNYVCVDESGKMRCKITYLKGIATGDYADY